MRVFLFLFCYVVRSVVIGLDTKVPEWSTPRQNSARKDPVIEQQRPSCMYESCLWSDSFQITRQLTLPCSTGTCDPKT